MQINLKYFGLVAEVAGTTEELMEFDQQLNSESMIQFLEEKYSGLHEIDYRLAINESLISDQVEIKENDTIAVLPPFSGG